MLKLLNTRLQMLMIDLTMTKKYPPNHNQKILNKESNYKTKLL